jgi:hypothetical protein
MTQTGGTSKESWKGPSSGTDHDEIMIKEHDQSLVKEALHVMERGRALELLQDYSIDEHYVDEEDGNESDNSDDNKDCDGDRDNSNSNSKEDPFQLSSNKPSTDAVVASLYVLLPNSTAYLSGRQDTKDGLAIATEEEETRKALIQAVATVGRQANDVMAGWHSFVAYNGHNDDGSGDCLKTESKSDHLLQRRGDFDAPPFMWYTGGDGPVFAAHIAKKVRRMKTGSTSTVGPLDVSSRGETCKEKPPQECFLQKSLLHLRAVCFYGKSILDEWYFVNLLFHLSERLSTEFSSQSMLLATEIWDAADGQVILIEGADFLPDWCTPQICRHRLWLVKGQLYLVEPLILRGSPRSRNKPLSTREALLCLAHHFQSQTRNHVNAKDQAVLVENRVVTAPKELRQLVLAKIMDKSPKSKDHSTMIINYTNPIPSLTLREEVHLAPCVLPVRLAVMIRQRPDLINCAVQVFFNLADQFLQEQEMNLAKKTRRSRSKVQPKESSTPNGDEQESSSFLPVGSRLPYTNLVTVVVPFSKLRYAMLRSANNNTDEQSHLPMPFEFRSAEAGRLKRQLAELSTSSNTVGDQNGSDQQQISSRRGQQHYLYNAMDNGVRVTLGFEWFVYMERWKDEYQKKELSSKSKVTHKGGLDDDNTLSSAVKLGDNERRVRVHWADLEHQLGGDAGWIDTAWEAGPAHRGTKQGSDSIEPLLTCPVYEADVKNNVLCPRSHPRQTLSQQLDVLWKKAETTSKQYSASAFPMPSERCVDNDEWRHVLSEEDLDNRMRTASRTGLSGTSRYSQQEKKSEGEACDPRQGMHTEGNPGKSEKEVEQLGSMLQSLNDFMDSPSDIDGVCHQTIQHDDGGMAAVEDVAIDTNELIDILSGTNKAQQVQQRNEAIYIDEDDDDGFYDEEEDSESESSGTGDVDEGLNEVMVSCLMELGSFVLVTITTDWTLVCCSYLSLQASMDAELENSGVRQTGITGILDPVMADSNAKTLDDPVKVDATVLSNLLESLEVESAGGIGPMSIMLREFGIDIPK